MARVVKLPEVRRQELMDCAQALFFDIGYDATTVSDIIARAGISKGGFYHHFDSKEALLEAVILRMAEADFRTMELGVGDGEDALAALNRQQMLRVRWNAERAPYIRGMMDALYRAPADIHLAHMAKAFHDMLRPSVTEIVEHGVASGQFDVVDTMLTVELLLTFWSLRHDMWRDIVAALDGDDLDAAIGRFQDHLTREAAMADRLLGLPRGSVFGASGEVSRALFEQVHRLKTSGASKARTAG